jgi:hypothetical protein
VSAAFKAASTHNNNNNNNNSSSQPEALLAGQDSQPQRISTAICSNQGA